MPTREAAPARRTVAMLIGLALLRGFVHDAESNFDIWQHKRYSNPPALAQGNGPIGKYRTWARQFYD